MPTNTLVGDLSHIAAVPAVAPFGVQFRALTGSDREPLAQLYLDSYPPGAAVDTLEEAVADVDATFAGDYGALWLAASLVAVHNGKLVGSIQVVRQSPWDPDLDCPFVIELFVDPNQQHRRIGTALLKRSAGVCLRSGQSSMALRTAGEAASPYALRLYRTAGMLPR